MEANELYFIYCSQRMNLSAIRLFDWSESKEHYQGMAEVDGDIYFRTYRKDCIVESYESLAELAKAEHSLQEFINSPENIYFNRPAPKPVDTFDVHFTGFKKDDKARLTELAKSANMKVRGEVTKHLNVLCYGYNAGPKKLEKARAQGVMIINEPEFLHFIETGEVVDCAIS
ncbi:hypothetical protein BZG06_10160 [Salinivibrio kushneri]|uniref:BRCT domain-containing protein n=1 Tax=Salinivibrio kushneri TaxID=1908198 RepID=A0AB36K873_9GAMM|nr:hypothetical protein [Salinivibrio kushneri]OOE43994.1 hypothetical protein BZG06_10160 [Salinivibrio kushneri]OOE45139.1 hypothetical protein BZG09_05400 [Salinivibrio kushneri]